MNSHIFEERIEVRKEIELSHLQARGKYLIIDNESKV